MLVAGLTYTKETTVTEQNTAQAMGSGDLPVFATPAMVALMEGTAAACVAAQLEPGQTTVGTKVNVSHVAASPLGATIRCEAQLEATDRRSLTFSVAAYDEAGLIGKGTHERFVVDAEKFTAKANAKLA